MYVLSAWPLFGATLITMWILLDMFCSSSTLHSLNNLCYFENTQDLIWKFVLKWKRKLLEKNVSKWNSNHKYGYPPLICQFAPPSVLSPLIWTPNIFTPIKDIFKTLYPSAHKVACMVDIKLFFYGVILLYFDNTN